MNDFRAPRRTLYQARTALGGFGEQLAERHLVGRGMQILSRNWRCELGELDRVALAWRARRRILVVVEVKTRYTQAFCHPAAAVTPKKYLRLRRLAARWLQVHPMHVDEIRIDVISVTVPVRGTPVLDHIEGVYL